MAKRAKNEQIFAPLDPLWGYPDMMSPKEISEFTGISLRAAQMWIQQNGGVVVIKGKQRCVWRIHKDYVRRALNLPKARA